MTSSDKREEKNLRTRQKSELEVIGKAYVRRMHTIVPHPENLLQDIYEEIAFADGPVAQIAKKRGGKGRKTKQNMALSSQLSSEPRLRSSHSYSPRSHTLG